MLWFIWQNKHFDTISEDFTTYNFLDFTNLHSVFPPKKNKISFDMKLPLFKYEILQFLSSRQKIRSVDYMALKEPHRNGTI